MRVHHLVTLAIVLFAHQSAAQSFPPFKPSDCLCAQKFVLYLGAPGLCESLGGEIIVKSVEKPTSQETTKFVQYGLTVLGYNPGPIDGIAGPQTATAILKFDSATNTQGDDVLFAKYLFYSLSKAGHLKRLETLVAPPTVAPVAEENKASDWWRPGADILVRILMQLKHVRR